MFLMNLMVRAAGAVKTNVYNQKPLLKVLTCLYRARELQREAVCLDFLFDFHFKNNLFILANHPLFFIICVLATLAKIDPRTLVSHLSSCQIQNTHRCILNGTIKIIRSKQLGQERNFFFFFFFFIIITIVVYYNSLLCLSLLELNGFWIKSSGPCTDTTTAALALSLPTFLIMIDICFRLLSLYFLFCMRI